jgi:acyl carrier protein
MEPPTVTGLARRLEEIVQLNTDEELVLTEEEYELPIMSLGIGSLDLAEWAFALQAEYDLIIEIDTLDTLVDFTLVDVQQWVIHEIAVQEAK